MARYYETRVAKGDTVNRAGQWVDTVRLSHGTDRSRHSFAIPLEDVAGVVHALLTTAATGDEVQVTMVDDRNRGTR